MKWPGLLVKNLTHVVLPSHTTGSVDHFAQFDKLQHFSTRNAEALEGTHHVTRPPGLGRRLCLYECEEVSRARGEAVCTRWCSVNFMLDAIQDSTGVLLRDVMNDTGHH